MHEVGARKVRVRTAGEVRGLGNLFDLILAVEPEGDPGEVKGPVAAFEIGDGLEAGRSVGLVLADRAAHRADLVGGRDELQVHLGWVVAAYDLGEALANLVQPLWMLPILGMFGLRARDVMGYTFIVFLALTPVVILLVTLLGATLPYPL